jgi:hypothetical protein
LLTVEPEKVLVILFLHEVLLSEPEQGADWLDPKRSAGFLDLNNALLIA